MHNILYVTHTAELGGAERSLLLLIERLDRGRYRPYAAVPTHGPLAERLDEMDVLHRTVAMPPLRRTRNPFRLARYALAWRHAARRISEIIQHLDVHLVHSNSTTAHLFASPAAVRRNVPCIWHVRDASSPGGRLEKRMTRDASAILAISEAMKAGLQYPELAASPVEVIPNGVSLHEFSPGDRMAVRKELDLGGTAPVAGIVGQIVPWKGHARFLEAAATVAGRLPDARFLVVGDNRFGDWPRLAADLKEKARELGLADRVLFLGWREDVPAVMNALDVLVMASENEPFGRVAIEAMACGKPVIAFRAGGPAEIIEHEKTGLLVEPGDVRALANAITQLLADPAAAEAMGVRARQAAGERFSAETYAARVQETYARLLG